MSGDRTQGDVLLNMDESAVTVTVARVAVALAVTVTYAILHFCARSVVLDALTSWWAKEVNLSEGVEAILPQIVG